MGGTEQGRLEALGRYHILDTQPDERFDRLTRLAAHVFDVPIALITLIDEERQWFKSRVGLTVSETARKIAICAETILRDDVMVVRDALQDARFRDNPLVTGDPEIRFYAGVPLITPDAYPIGTFVLIDRKPRELSSQEQRILKDFGAVTMDELELWRRLVKANKEHTQELARAEARIRQAEHLEALGRLAGGVAHDFNNMLTVILGNAWSAIEAMPKDSAVVSDLVQISAAAEKASTMTRRILAFARKQTLAPTVAEINSLIEDLKPFLERLVGSQISINFEPRAVNCYGLVDAAQFDQVLMNLCANARDAMPEGGDIRISTERVSVNGGNADAGQGEFIKIEVEDSGEGMSAEAMEHAFDPFFTTKEPGKGTGLGLAILHGIIRQHGGFVELDSQLGQGTRAAIFLPLTTQKKTSKKPIAPALGTTRGQETILLADDEDMVRGVTARVLRDAGYDLLEASDGEEAVALFEQYPAHIKLVILDARMPRLDGPNTLRKIRALQPDVAYLLISGCVPDTLVSEERANHWLEKPYTPSALLTRVRAILDTPAVGKQL